MKEEGKDMFRKGDYQAALKCFKHSLKKITNEKEKVKVLSNIAQCCINLRLYEDAVSVCDVALKLDKYHLKTVYRKAKALAYLFDFEQSQTLAR